MGWPCKVLDEDYHGIEEPLKCFCQTDKTSKSIGDHFQRIWWPSAGCRQSGECADPHSPSHVELGVKWDRKASSMVGKNPRSR